MAQTPQQLWETLELDAWESSAIRTTGGARNSVLTGVRNTWGTTPANGLSAAQRTAIGNAIQRWRTAEQLLVSVAPAGIGVVAPVIYAFRATLQRAAARDEVIASLEALFESLAKMGNIMWRGDVDGQREEWREIMHGDLKSSNVFLGQKHSSGIYDRYPWPKLGDFGHAIIWPRRPARNSTLRDLAENTDVWNLNDGAYSGNDYGTVGFMAPEQVGHVFELPLGRARPDAKTNVWGVGLILWCMIKHCPGGLDTYVDDKWPLTPAQQAAGRALDLTNPFNWPLTPAQSVSHPNSVVFTPAEVNNYSSELRDLVMHCLQYHPNNRPQFDQVLRRIKTATLSAAEDPTRVDRAFGLRRNPDDPRWATYALKPTNDAWLQGLPIATGLATVDRTDADQPPPPTLAQIRKRKRQEDDDLGGPAGDQLPTTGVPPDSDDDGGDAVDGDDVDGDDDDDTPEYDDDDDGPPDS